MFRVVRVYEKLNLNRFECSDEFVLSWDEIGLSWIKKDPLKK
jgi:hypothetical protein